MRLDVKDFANSFGLEEKEMPLACKEMISKLNFEYEILKGGERDIELLGALKRIEEDKQIIAAPERTEVWNSGWNENLEMFCDSNYDLDSLIPKFYRKNICLRWNQNFIRSENAQFEYNYFCVFRRWVFETYLNNVENIYEFGCGSGHNLVELVRMYPEKHIVGLDFVPSVIELLKTIKKKRGLNIEGSLFDMIHPDFDMNIKSNSAFYTFGAIEQLAGQIQNLFQFFLDKKPKICIHMEPMIEWYDENNLLDYLALRFHKKRGYTEGIFPLLEKLQCEKKVEIMKTKRLYFGNYNMEGYNLIVWRPL